MRKVLFISPHLDDAVLSCGACIAALTATGVQVVIATVFTGSGAAIEQQLLYETRKRDDIKAITLLGAGVRHLGYTDAPFRNSSYHNFNTLLFHHRLPEEEQALVHAIAAALDTLIAELQPDNIWFPLGVGGHIDHHIVYESSRLLTGARVTGYYEELPYALLPGWNAVRLAHIQAMPGTGKLPHELQPVTFDETGLHFVKNYVTSPEDAAHSAARLAKEWEALPAGKMPAAQWTLNGTTFTYAKVVYTEEYLQQKCGAIACYTTEYPALFGEAKRIKDGLCATLKGDSYYEISWLNNIL